MIRLDRIVQAQPPNRRRERGLRRQLGSREAERTARASAVGFALWLKKRGTTTRSIARRLSVSASGVSRWLSRWRENRMAVRSRGRPIDDVDRETRAGILSV